MEFEFRKAIFSRRAVLAKGAKDRGPIEITAVILWSEGAETRR